MVAAGDRAHRRSAARAAGLVRRLRLGHLDARGREAVLAPDERARSGVGLARQIAARPGIDPARGRSMAKNACGNGPRTTPLIGAVPVLAARRLAALLYPSPGHLFAADKESMPCSALTRSRPRRCWPLHVRAPRRRRSRPATRAPIGRSR